MAPYGCAMRRSISRATVVAAGLLLGATGCGGSDDGSNRSTPSTAARRTTTTVPPTTGTTQPAPSVERAALQLAPVLSSTPCPPAAATTTTTAAPDTSTTGSTATTTTGAGGGDGPVTTIPETTVPETTVPVPTIPEGGADGVPDAAGTTCHRLGPVGIDGNGLHDATFRQTDGWDVLVRARDEAADRFHAMIDECLAGGPTCPAGAGGTGAIAVIWNGTVISLSPTVDIDPAEDTPFIIPRLTERQARDLAALVNH